MILHRRNFRGRIINIVAVVSHVGHVGIARSQAAYASFQVAEIKLTVAVTVVGPIDKKIRPLDEMHAVLRLHPGVVALLQKSTHETAVRSVVEIEMHLVLTAVHHLDQQHTGIGSPAHSGEIALIGEVADIQRTTYVPEGVAYT